MRSSDWSSDVCSADLQSEHRAGVPHRCLADFVAPASSGLHDYVGAFAVTTGIGAAERIAAFRKANDDYSAIILEALADRLAEAFAERLHQRRSDERRVGKECVSTCRPRWVPVH